MQRRLEETQQALKAMQGHVAALILEVRAMHIDASIGVPVRRTQGEGTWAVR